MRPGRVDGSVPDAGEDLELVVATDQRGAGYGAGPGCVQWSEHVPGSDRLALALRSDRLELRELERVPDQLVGLTPDQHAARGCRVLQTRGGVGDVAGRERLAGRRVDRDDGLPGAHRAPELEIEAGVLEVQLVDALDDRQRRADGPLGVVGLRERRPEDRHDGVTDVLLDDAAVVLDPRARVVEVQLVAIADVLGVGAVGTRRRTDHVDEQDRDELPLLLVLSLLGAARRAEAGALGKVGATRDASHGRIVGRSAPTGG